jgi:hypothetical protein
MSTEIIYCELCGEQLAEISTDHVGMCGDCFGREVSETLISAGIGHYCCRPLFRAGVISAVCMHPYGTEHEHSG